MTPELRFAEAMAEFCPDGPPASLGLAVSGGGDSLALFLLALEWAAVSGVSLAVATVDHGLRPEAAREAAFVARTCAAHAVPHTTLSWDGWAGRGNLQAEARAGRYALLSDWAIGARLHGVALGHTADDQAETVLMNLARGSGVDGLTGMRRSFERGGTRFVRPLLGVTREALRGVLVARAQTWVDDPSNEDTRFDRVRARRLLAEAEDLGLSRERVLATAERMRDASEVLNERAILLLNAADMHAGDVLLPRRAFDTAPRDTRFRVLATCLCMLSGNPYRPRYQSLRSMADGLSEGKGGVLHGCRVTAGAESLRVAREAAAVADVVSPVGAPWDRRFVLSGPDADGDEVRALGRAAFGPLPEERDITIPRESLAAAPSVWRAGALLAAPLAGIGSGWRCDTLQEEADLTAGLLSR